MSTPTEKISGVARSRIDRETLAVAAGLAAAAVLTLVFTTLSTRMLGARASGDFLTAVFVLSFALTASGPLGGTASRFAAQHQARGETDALRGLPHSLSAVAWIGVAGAVVLLGFGLMTTSFSLDSMPMPWWIFTAWTALALTFVSLTRGMLRGLGLFAEFNENILIESGCRLVVGLALVWVFRSAAAGILGYAIAATLCLALGWRRVGSVLGPGPRAAVEPRRHLGFLLPMGLMALAYASQQNLDVLVVRGLFEPSEAGAYGAAAILAQTATMLLTPFSTTLLPRVSGIHGRTGALGREGALLLLRHAIGYLVVCLPLLVAFAFGGEWLVTTLYGPDFAPGGAWLATITASIVAGGLGLLVMQCLAAQGSFGFLAPYWISVAVAFGWISAGASNPAEVAWILLRVKLVTLGLLTVLLSRTLSTSRTPRADSTPCTSVDVGAPSARLGAGR